jgi:glycosidase
MPSFLHVPCRAAVLRAAAVLLAAGALAATGCAEGDDELPTGSAAAAGGASGAGGGGGAAQGGGDGSGGGVGEGGMAPHDGVETKIVVYQLAVRTFSNTNETRAKDGTIEQNGVGKFDDIDGVALASIAELGATHVWLTGVLRQATMTSYPGLPADDPDVVKGRAGSFYAVRDYFDVSPDYANDVDARLEELDALVARIHDAGMKVILDLVPNHVARGYGSVVEPERDFGRDDDTSRFFGEGNDFFYLADPPGQALSLARPAGWDPPGVTFDGAYGREDGQEGRTPRATGNNVTSPSPGATDWYETVKLNWGLNFADGSTRFEPRPPVWDKMDAILAYWQGRGVDGFRADFAHYVPSEAWRWLLERVKERDPDAYVFAEAYDNLDGLLGAGFDAVYDDPAYDLLKRIYQGKASQADLDAHLGSFEANVRGRYVHYLENHDERRIASPIDASGSEDQSGFGSADAGRQLAPILYLFSQGPVLFYAGQEVGEPGAGAEGFGGDDGRTTIFDYWSMPAMVGWVNGHAYDGGGLTDAQRQLRAYYGDLLRLCQDPSVRGAGYWGLRYVNNAGANGDANDALFTFARYAAGGRRLVLVAANLGTGGEQRGKVRVPAELADAAALGADLEVRLVLGGDGAADEVVATTTRDDLASAGFEAIVGDQRANVYAIE